MSFVLLFTILLSILSFFLVKNNVLQKAGSKKKLNSLPKYYGYNAVFWIVVTNISLMTILLTNFKLPNSLIIVAITSSTIFLLLFFIKKISPSFKAREHYEKILANILKISATLSILLTIAIVLSIFFEAVKFFKHVSVFDFLFGLEWSPQIALRSDQSGSSGAFGIIPVFLGTLLIMLIAMVVSVPLGIISAVYLSEYANPKFRKYAKSTLEILAGIPTVVYGYFAAFTVAPLIKDFAKYIGLEAASESALAAGLVMGIMIIPFVLSLSDDVMRTVPESLRNASLGLGATKSETTKKVILPAALPGISGAVLLAISRAIGETMIVTMAAGIAANLTLNPLNSVTTATVQIVTLLIGDQEFDSVKTLSAFALGLALFIVTLILNIIALVIVKKYHEQYD